MGQRERELFEAGTVCEIKREKKRSHGEESVCEVCAQRMRWVSTTMFGSVPCFLDPMDPGDLPWEEKVFSKGGRFVSAGNADRADGKKWFRAWNCEGENC